VGTSDDGNGKGGLGKAGPDVPEARLDRPDWKALGDHARDPWPLSRELFLVAAEDKVFLCHADGRTEVLYDIYPGRDEKKRYAPQDVPADLPLDKAALAEVRQRRQEEALRRKRPLEPMTGYDLVLKAGYRAHDPVPPAPRPRELVLPPQVDLSKTTGTLVLADAHVGRNMTGVQAGEVRKLLVLEILPLPAHETVGAVAGPMYSVVRALGTVPVEPDGSANMRLPAMRSLFFVSLDANDVSVKRMQSYLALMPGETTSCVGCHERRTTNVLPRAKLLALKRPPSEIAPLAGIPDIIGFGEHILPILEKRCAGCHAPGKSAARLDLTGRMAARSLMHRGPKVQDARPCDAKYGRGLYLSYPNAIDPGNMPPRTLGTSASPLMKYLQPNHPTCRHALTKAEHDTIRIWIDVGCQTNITHQRYKKQWA